MVVITPEQFRKAVPRCTAPDAWVAALNPAMAEFYIATDVDYVVEFLAQCAHESQSFNRLDESLTYSAQRLTEVWPRRFPTLASALPYSNAPHALAEFVYGGRMGNGPAGSGDGWKFRGRGIPMVTGADNYKAVAKLIGDPMLVTCPDRLQTKAVAARAGAAWWAANPKLNALADDTATDDDVADTKAISIIVNGGKVGLAERLAFRTAFKRALTT